MERSTERDLPGRVGFVYQALVQAFGTGQIRAQLRRDKQVVEHEPPAVMEHREALRFGNYVFDRKQCRRAAEGQLLHQAAAAARCARKIASPDGSSAISERAQPVENDPDVYCFLKHGPLHGRQVPQRGERHRDD